MGPGPSRALSLNAQRGPRPGQRTHCWNEKGSVLTAAESERSLNQLLAGIVGVFPMVWHLDGGLRIAVRSSAISGSILESFQIMETHQCVGLRVRYRSVG